MEETRAMRRPPRDMFHISLRHFRRIMCSTKYTLEQKDSAFDGLAEDYFRCDLEDKDIKFFEVIVKEWSRRREYEEFTECARNSIGQSNRHIKVQLEDQLFSGAQSQNNE